MRIPRVLLPCIIGLSLSAAASAEIYQSKDAQGNTVFSDIPSQGAESVKLPTTNSADPVVETARPVDATESPAPKKVSTKPARPVQRAKDVDDNYDDDYYYYGSGDYDKSDLPRKDRPRRDDDAGQPDRDRPHVTPHRNTSRPAAGGGGGRR